MAFIPCENAITDNSIKQFLLKGAGTSSNPASASMELDCENRNLLYIKRITITGSSTVFVRGIDSTGYMTEIWASTTGTSFSDVEIDISEYNRLYFQIVSWDGTSDGFLQIDIK